MKLAQFLTVGAASLTAALPFDGQLEGRASCASGVHIIVARASTEAQGEGIIGGVASMIEARIPGSDDVAIVYPALLEPYQPSEAAGVSAMTSSIQSYVAQCPKTKIVLLGYSQGAQVIADTLGGTSEAGFTTTAPLASQYGSHINSVILMGDPSHVVGQSYDVGTSRKNGLFPRTNFGPLNVYASRIQSYCDNSDEFCDSGTSLATHLGYVTEYGTAATNFVVSKAG